LPQKVTDANGKSECTGSPVPAIAAAP
jgi:hypothetical protein